MFVVLFVKSVDKLDSLFVWFVFCRKKCSEAKKSELVEKILNLIAGHSHEVSILRPIKIKTFESFWANLDYDLNLKIMLKSVLIITPFP